nr:hypothetical protein CFP56_72896 [Quercus suber]
MAISWRTQAIRIPPPSEFRAGGSPPAATSLTAPTSTHILDGLDNGDLMEDSSHPHSPQVVSSPPKAPDPFVKDGQPLFELSSNLPPGDDMADNPKETEISSISKATLK